MLHHKQAFKITIKLYLEYQYQEQHITKYESQNEIRNCVKFFF